MKNNDIAECDESTIVKYVSMILTVCDKGALNFRNIEYIYIYF